MAQVLAEGARWQMAPAYALAAALLAAWLARLTRGRRAGRVLGLAGPIGAERAHTIINAYTVAFFDKHVKGVGIVLPEFPGVRVETRTPAQNAGGR
ncbi:hypothetical protein ABZ897_37105 [Nonomuraea sp. NPDC046802]|uniref:hypothetical protein n=1 Tax=Nonomuraea sp. NPDC046802 TaxID=3154919 RepID=UPI0033CC5F66